MIQGVIKSGRRVPSALFSIRRLVLTTAVAVGVSLLASSPLAQTQATPDQTSRPRPIGENGITVGRAKVFDNRTLTLLLENLSETLKGLQVIDQDPLKKAIGLLQGSQTRDVSRGISLLAGGVPKTVTTQDSSTQTDREPRGAPGAAAGSEPQQQQQSIEELIDKKVTENLGLKTETTTSERNPALPNLPDLIASPSGLPAFGQNAADLLTDQVNLTYQILNIRMVLERSLSDRLLPGGDARLQAVLGFNVSVDPPRDAENSAAVVEVTVSASNGEPVSLVSVMPQEKTYNAVAMNTRSNAFGGSAVAGMFTVGYSERRRGQVFYLYRDNDTLSFERMLTKDKTDLTFGWQFRPVLGRKSVSPGMRQMFAVVSLPVSDDPKAAVRNQNLRVSVRTYWRKYHADTLTTSDRENIGAWPYLRRVATLGLSEAVPNPREARRLEDGGVETVTIPTTAEYQQHLQPEVTNVEWTRIDEKTALISVAGKNFFSGTSVAMGGTAAASGVVIKSNQAMDIVTPIENIGAGTPMVIGRYGVARPLATASGCSPTMGGLGATLGPAISGLRELRVPVDCPVDELTQLVVFANGKSVPGTPSVIADVSTNVSLVSAQIPVALFPKGDGTLALVRPFRRPFRIDIIWYENPYELKRMIGDKKTILYLQRTDAISLTNPKSFGSSPTTRWKVEHAGKPVTLAFPTDRVIRFELDGTEAQGTIALFEPTLENSFNLYLLDLPPAKPKPKEAIEAVAGPLVINQGDAPKLDFTGERIADVAAVRIEGREPFKSEHDATKKVLSVFIPQEVTKLPGKLALQFRDAAAKSIATMTLEVKALPKEKPAAKAASKAEKD